MTTHLPEPERTQRDRTIDFTWRTPSHDGDYDGPMAAYGELSVWHHKERKTFVASLDRYHTNGRIVRRAITFGRDGGGTILTQPIARFSQTRLEAFARDALAQLHRLYDVRDPKVTAMLPPADFEGTVAA
jgi:hypothetical protein